MENLSVAILAHVDAGKTTLSEAMLFESGMLRKRGRVDHGDAFLDTDPMERERGITIFSKLALMELEGLSVTFMDTPGHVDFAAEAERTLAVCDAAILVVSATEPVQGHTVTLWNLLRRYNVPAFIFVNKMDLPGADRAAVMRLLTSRLSGSCAAADGELFESAATADDGAMEEYLASGFVSREAVARLIGERRLFPVCFGSALKGEGVAEFLRIFAEYAPVPVRPAEFGARVYKIARDPSGARLTYLKITGGTLKVKAPLEDGKIDQVRLYSGEKYRLLQETPAGSVVAVTGLDGSYIGRGYGTEKNGGRGYLEPVIRYTAEILDGTDPASALTKLRALSEEEPQLRVEWNEFSREISLRLMGEVQLEVIEKLLLRRFGLAVRFTRGGIVYRETVKNTVEGVGHFEPLRHYAEVHLILEPLSRGAGLVFASSVPEDELDRNWQRLILTHLVEKQHLGVLTGSPITDMKITLAAGRAHLKHTEGGDFREATYRAVRMGLMQAECLLLEPWYDFILTLPQGDLGRAMTDLDRMGARVDPPVIDGGTATLTGSVPVSELHGYDAALASYTRGQGRLAATFRGFEECHNAEAVILASGYDPERDILNPSDSVFCSHGAGVTVKWSEVPLRMHLESALKGERPETATPEIPEPRRAEQRSLGAEAADKELRAIFERTYGEVKRRDFVPKEERKKYEPRTALPEGPREIKPRFTGAEYLLVDGYNVIFAWDELRKVAEESVDAARKVLMDVLSNFRGIKKNEVILVFDAYKVTGGTGSVSSYNGISVVYTKEAETADSYIEKTAHKLSKSHKVYVATSDGPEQMIILGSGALRMTAAELKGEIELSNAQIGALMRRLQLQNRTRQFEEAYKRAESGDKRGK